SSFCLAAQYHHHHALPPFPTRRSSDLVAASADHRSQQRGAPLGTRTVPRHLREQRAHHSRRHARTSRVRRADDSRLGVGDQQRQDRKSTRLNSSHVKISYAVFCLKKKK